jgi:predicted Zn-dependent peptidase
MELLTHRLPNGIRLVHLPVPNLVAHCGVFINAGSRDELETEHGIAHFIEHTIFKGTRKRNVVQILNRLENVGADLNAYTTKEETCIHASFLHEFYDRTLELFSDILFHSVFPENEIEREKLVVADEIQSFRDTPAEQIFDDFEDHLFEGHPLGRNILGTSKSLKKLKQKDILDFIHRNYLPGEVVIASVGRIEFKRFVGLVTRYFSENPERGVQKQRAAANHYTPFSKSVKKRTSQVHCMVGAPGFPYSDIRRIPLALINNLLGGPLMNSRLSLALRERNGLTYHNESNYTTYSDAGIIQIYFGTEAAHYEQALGIVHDELKKLRDIRLTPMQMQTVRKQITGQLAIGHESNIAHMLAIGKSYLLQDHFAPIEKIIARINETTPAELQEISNEVFAEEQLSMLTFR